jgi:hypothetical protein
LYDLEENTNDNYNTLEQPSYQKKRKKKKELKILMNPRLKLRSKDQKQTIVFSVSFP